MEDGDDGPAFMSTERSRAVMRKTTIITTSDESLSLSWQKHGRALIKNVFYLF